MMPTAHVAITFVVSLLFALRFVKTPDVIVFVTLAVTATIIIDLDHLVYVLISKEKFAESIRKLLMREGIKKAFIEYSAKRKKEVSKLVLHTLPVFVFLSLISVLVILIRNTTLIAIFVFGFYLHIISDLVEDIIFKKNIRYWKMQLKH